MAISREAATKQRELQRVKVFVPDWADEGTDPKDAYVWVRMLTGKERDEFDASMQLGKGKVTLRNLRAKAAVLSCEDDQGNKIFTATDIDLLGNGPSAPLSSVFDAFMDLNRMSQGDVDELAGESGPGQS